MTAVLKYLAPEATIERDQECWQVCKGQGHGHDPRGKGKACECKSSKGRGEGKAWECESSKGQGEGKAWECEISKGQGEEHARWPARLFQMPLFGEWLFELQ